MQTGGHCPLLYAERIRVISLIREDQTPGLSLQSSNCSVVYCSKIKLQAGGVQHTAVRAISTLGCVQIVSAGIWPRLCRRELSWDNSFIIMVQLQCSVHAAALTEQKAPHCQSIMASGSGAENQYYGNFLSQLTHSTQILLGWLLNNCWSLKTMPD